MKKNMLSIITLALLLVNIILTAVMMFSTTSTNRKVADLVTNISSALSLELTPPGQQSAEDAVSLADTEVYALTGSMTIPTAMEYDAEGKGKQGYFMCNISFSINTKHEDYKKNGSAEAMAGREELIKDAVNSVVSKHTISELQADAGLDGLKAEILSAVQGLFESDFIYKVSISEVKFG
ncbi:MAG: flagellar basal body-associated FliL family protein [Butyrivibrio sp.]|nr:flagellar basal body-associated FliL family protein [Muribaculum sp.]MCM1552024.1 flagellar basal body-associated FliL family protein [Butyrivibrio sp.]